MTKWIKLVQQFSQKPSHQIVRIPLTYREVLCVALFASKNNNWAHLFGPSLVNDRVLVLDIATAQELINAAIPILSEAIRREIRT